MLPRTATRTNNQHALSIDDAHRHCHHFFANHIDNKGYLLFLLLCLVDALSQVTSALLSKKQKNELMSSELISGYFGYFIKDNGDIFNIIGGSINHQFW